LIILGVAVGSNAYMRHRLSVKFDEMKVLTQKIEEFALVSVADTKIRKDSERIFETEGIQLPPSCIYSPSSLCWFED